MPPEPLHLPDAAPPPGVNARIERAILAELRDPLRRRRWYRAWRDRVEPALVAALSLAYTTWAIAAALGG